MSGVLFTDMQRTTVRLVLVVAAAGLALGALGGVAAAQGVGDSVVDVNTSVEAADNGGFADVECTGSPTDHDCTKAGALNAGPLGIDYEGFNDDSLAERSMHFGDTFVITVAGETVTIGFTCDIGLETPDGNPCPVDAPGP